MSNSAENTSKYHVSLTQTSQSLLFTVFADIMAVPPAFADLGKAAKDVFNKGYGNTAEHTAFKHAHCVILTRVCF